jgi:hypothetical protein
MSEKVMGNCPMGCGDTLFLGSGGYVTCLRRGGVVTASRIEDLAGVLYGPRETLDEL